MDSLVCWTAQGHRAIASKRTTCRAIFFVMAFLFSEVANARECGAAQDILRQSQQAGYQRFLITDVVNIDENEGRTMEETAGVRMTVRETLESRLQVAEQAVTYAKRAAHNGDIQPGHEHEFVVTSREILFLSLKQHGATAGTVGILVGPDGSGVMLRRLYDFPNEAREGEMKAADEVCIQARLQKAARWPAGRPASAAAILQGAERADCKSMSSIAFPCASLSKQLELAKAAKESVFATARSGSAIWVFTLNDEGRGRSLYVDPAGTALLIDQYFDAAITF
ncbi:hypothetical protein Q8F57_033350 [Paraburkholderia terrae]|uniref:hypothetical protein n=1 Tax=Paraburkholderia terrae TaxID=311230 RepID=UPI00296ABE8F|nr:hypothetical protein [Paraburkholderia terrae]MDW3662811.1 hypothetical protein [Paraburkholderia terrae]